MPDELPATCPECGAEVTGWNREAVDATGPGDTYRIQVPGDTTFEPCGCVQPARVTEAFPVTEFPQRYVLGLDTPNAGPDAPTREQLSEGIEIPITGQYEISWPGRLLRTPSGEHTSADTADVVADIDSAIEDWERSPDAATWTADGSHEHDPDWWTTQDMGNGAIYGGRGELTLSNETYLRRLRERREGHQSSQPIMDEAHEWRTPIHWEFNDEPILADPAFRGIRTPWADDIPDQPRDLTPTYEQIQDQIAEIVNRYAESMAEVARRWQDTLDNGTDLAQRLRNEGWAVWSRDEARTPELPEGTPVEQVARLAAEHGIEQRHLNVDHLTIRGLDRDGLRQLDQRVRRLQEPRYPS